MEQEHLPDERSRLIAKVESLLQGTDFHDVSSFKVSTDTIPGVALNALKGQSLRRYASLDTNCFLDIRIRELSTARLGKRSVQNLYIDAFTMGDAEGRSTVTLWEYDLIKNSPPDEVIQLLAKMIDAEPSARESLSRQLTQLYKSFSQS